MVEPHAFDYALPVGSKISKRDIVIVKAEFVVFDPEPVGLRARLQRTMHVGADEGKPTYTAARLDKSALREQPA